jgi:hypothetical protein
MSASWAVRVLRATVFAVMCVTLSDAAHRLAVGTTPPAWADGCGFLAVLAVACPLGGRERSLTGIGAGMLTVQTALHFAFDTARPRMPGMAGMDGVHHAVTAYGAGAHLLAALLASWWLRRGEAAFWSLLRRARALARGLAAWWRGRTGPVAPALGASALPPCPTPVRSLLLRHAVSRRGPPVPA